MEANNDLLVIMEGIEKSFFGNKVLKECKFELQRGEVHALVGENGAGKSTLMKILSGIYTKDAGRIIYKGKEVEFKSPRIAQSSGIAMINQELSLIHNLNVAENIFIGREQRKGARFLIDEKRIIEKTHDLLNIFGIDLNPYTKVSDLSFAKQEMVEIVKALSLNPEVLIMDEPTAALTDSEIDKLFRIVRDICSKGVGVIHISHRLEEIKQIADRATVMRDGFYVDTVNAKDIKIKQIIKMMTGKTIYEGVREISETTSRNIVLEVKNLARGNLFENVSFKLKEGEILGFYGLVGAGRTEVARAIFGADAIDSGEIYIHGERVNIKSPSDAVNQGIGYLSEDRREYGLILDMDVKLNVVLSSFNKFIRFFCWINDQKIKDTVNNFVDKFKVKVSSLEQKVKYLSGGNQQKVVISKWLLRNNDILIFDEPTHGIDVGAKNEIYKLIKSLAKQGKSIILISSEISEILRMSQRIIVMCEGCVTGDIKNSSEVTQEKIIEFAMEEYIKKRTA
jgi:ribose transport system ATP-binding protein